MRVKGLLLSIALVATLATVPAAGSAGAEEDPRPCRDAPTEPVRTGAVFNDPVGGDPTAIVRQICDLVHQAPSGSRIRIAHFVVSGDAGMDFATELVAAHRRGVDVQLVLDGWQDTTPAAEALRAELGTDKSRDSWMHVCSRVSPEGNTSSCIGTKGQHNKFYLFSRTGGASDVVVQSSANFTDLNSRTYWNNATTLVGNRKLYRAYDAYFEDLAAERATDDYYRTTSTGMPGGAVRAYFFPRAEGDHVLEILGKVSCDDGSTIDIGMSEWDTYRIGIARRLVALSGQGCEVRIVHGLMDAEVLDTLSADPSIELRALENSAALPGRIHSKYFLINAEFDGERDARWVFTGSPNWNHTSLRRNDEAMIQTNIENLYEAYEANFAHLFASGV
ncbi:phospholipase D-like domain-containing protein [Actinophytocola gossypii]|uniref:phospholipase D n=1 Tax=Actinophytocola gossypii TaxID=2812003 RepID=A0ABT2J1N9_9PSEU|nr:phospholipase D-like domain-containing protein [Actinophytocola gossypii]MCT2581774.1 phosphatidylserine/phosphatidylglycerophosphate/cardiolipin synthase family protein [Actinophytocola gossypii]